MGWVISGRALHSETARLAQYAPDPLAKDRLSCLAEQIPLGTFLVTVAVRTLLVVGTWTGGIHAGIGLVLWEGIFLRVTLGLHATWLVNSATHLWGKRRFETRDDSPQQLVGGSADAAARAGITTITTANPVSARHGLRWYEFDPNYYGIWLLEKLGIARNVQIAKFVRPVEVPLDL